MTMPTAGPIKLEQIATDTDLGSARRRLNDEYMRAKLGLAANKQPGTNNKLSNYRGASYGIYPPNSGKNWEPSNGEKYWNYYKDEVTGGSINGRSRFGFNMGTTYPPDSTGRTWREGIYSDIQTYITMPGSGNCYVEYNTRWFNGQGTVTQYLRSKHRNVYTTGVSTASTVDIEIVGWSGGYRVGTPSILLARKENQYNLDLNILYQWTNSASFKYGISTKRSAIRAGSTANSLIGHYCSEQRSYIT